MIHKSVIIFPIFVLLVCISHVTCLGTGNGDIYAAIKSHINQFNRTNTPHPPSGSGEYYDSEYYYYDDDSSEKSDRSKNHKISIGLKPNDEQATELLEAPFWSMSNIASYFRKTISHPTLDLKPWMHISLQVYNALFRSFGVFGFIIYELYVPWKKIRLCPVLAFAFFCYVFLCLNCAYYGLLSALKTVGICIFWDVYGAWVYGIDECLFHFTPKSKLCYYICLASFFFLNELIIILDHGNDSADFHPIFSLSVMFHILANIQNIFDHCKKSKLILGGYVAWFIFAAGVSTGSCIYYAMVSNLWIQIITSVLICLIYFWIYQYIYFSKSAILGQKKPSRKTASENVEMQPFSSNTPSNP